MLCFNGTKLDFISSFLPLPALDNEFTQICAKLLFCLDEGNRDISASSPEDSSMQTWKENVPNTENGHESKDDQDKNTVPTSPSSKEPKGIKLEATNTRGISLRSKLIPFAPFMETQSYTPPVSDQPFEPPSDSADDMSGGSRSSTAEGRPISPDSVVSITTAASPSPPLTPNSAAKKVFDFKGGAASSQSRRQWGVTDKVTTRILTELSR